jgi:predicted ATPase
MYPILATVIRGWSLFALERREEAIEQMREGLERLQSTGTEFIRPHFLGLLAETLGKAHRHDEALRLLDEAISLTDRNGERYYQAELYRLKGELLLMQSNLRGVSSDYDPTTVAEAERCFNESIKIARQQQAKSWELRAVMSMARLYQHEGKQDQARSCLTRVHAGFTEGFDTVDLREARALLDQLS